MGAQVEYGFEGTPLLLEGGVQAGFGRGSRDLGFPTANLPPQQGDAAEQRKLEALPQGVYFGCGVRVAL